MSRPLACHFDLWHRNADYIFIVDLGTGKNIASEAESIIDEFQRKKPDGLAGRRVYYMDNEQKVGEILIKENGTFNKLSAVYDNELNGYLEKSGLECLEKFRKTKREKL